MSEFEISKRELCTLFIDIGTRPEHIQKYLEDNYSLTECGKLIVVERIQKDLVSKFNDRWSKANRTRDRFFSKNSAWLEGNFAVKFDEPGPSSSDVTSTGNRGRPCKPYDELSDKSKKRKHMDLINEHGFETIQNAYVQGLRSQGELEEASIVSMIRTLSKDDKKAIKNQLFHETKNVTSYTVDEALSIYIDLDLSKSQYGYLRACLAVKNCYILPSYKMISNAKQQCYPPQASIEVTDTCAKVKLQDLLDHTVSRILQIESTYKPGSINLKLFTKWGCDGSSGQSEYKQILSGEDELTSDANLFIASLVPIKLINTVTNEILWQNNTCSSVRYCRPIYLEFAKETPEKTRSVVADIRSQINNLTATTLTKNNQDVQVRHELFLTMIDGKVTQVLTNTSSSSVCTICGARPSEMNNLSRVTSKPENETAYEYGLSTLHAWIRCMDLILHISYNISFKKWSATTPENKKSKEDKKKLVQSLFRNQMGLHIDKPRQGTGNSNDGNTARRFFENYHCTSEITGVDEGLIRRFYVILQTLASGMSVNPERFGAYALQTANIYVDKYDWYYMPSSVHKILIHGESIIRHFAILPIGKLSEDAQESRNKDYKRIRLSHARKCSRSSTNEDVFHALLYTSDPYISSLRKPTETISKDLFEEAVELLDNN